MTGNILLEKDKNVHLDHCHNYQGLRSYFDDKYPNLRKDDMNISIRNTM